MPVRPITPKEASAGGNIPDVVLETVNDYLKARGSMDRIVLTQNELLTLLEGKGVNRREAFEKGWLNFEEVYRAAGWDVEYDKPGYNESSSAFFTFSR